MDHQLNEFEIIDIYYADCVQMAGIIPQWSAARTRQELTDEGSLNKLREQLLILRRKRKLAYAFGNVPIHVDHPRNENVRQILQHIQELPLDLQEKDELLQYGDVLARKYLQTRYSRTRLFIVLRVTSNGGIFVFTLIADLKDDSIQQINRDSLNFTTQAIRNIYGDLKKGSVYPAIFNGQRNENEIMIYDEGDTKHYPESLECVLKLAPENEAKALVKVLSETCELSHNQVGRVFNEIRAIENQHLGRNELGQALERAGIQVNQERIERAWRKNFNYDYYEISPSVLSLESVQLKIKLDEFEINCPLNYFPERINHHEEEGFQYLTLRGQEYSELRTGSSVILFAE